MQTSPAEVACVLHGLVVLLSSASVFAKQHPFSTDTVYYMISNLLHAREKATRSYRQEINNKLVVCYSKSTFFL